MYSSPSVLCRVLAFAECKIVFAECLRHSAKKLSPVVKAALKFVLQLDCAAEKLAAFPACLAGAGRFFF
jgi:hypothetical protein